MYRTDCIKWLVEPRKLATKTVQGCIAQLPVQPAENSGFQPSQHVANPLVARPRQKLDGDPDSNNIFPTFKV